jgi:hypothetical protein
LFLARPISERIKNVSALNNKINALENIISEEIKNKDIPNESNAACIYSITVLNTHNSFT